MASSWIYSIWFLILQGTLLCSLTYVSPLPLPAYCAPVSGTLLCTSRRGTAQKNSHFFFSYFFFFLQFLGKKHLALGTLCGQLRWQRLEFPFSFVMRSSVSWLLGLPCSPMCCFFMTNLLVQSFCIRASKKAPWDCDLQGVALVCCREGLWTNLCFAVIIVRGKKSWWSS